MGIPLRLLLIEDSEEDVQLVVRVLQKDGYDPCYLRVDTAEAMSEALNAESWDIIISDYHMPHFSGNSALSLFREKGLDIPFVIVSGVIGEEVAVEIMKAGAHDYVMKGNLARLVPAVRRELKEVESRRERRRIEEALRDKEEHYRSLFENMLNGFAYCRMHFDESDRPVDFTYLAVNRAFETQTGLSNVTGMKASDVIPGIREADSDLLEIYGRVSRTGKPERVEILVHSLHMWLWLSVYSPEHGYFVAVFDVITERKQAEESLRQISEKLRRSLIGTIQVMSLMVETKDPYTAGHQRRVSRLARTIAQEMGLPKDTVDNIRMAGAVHDIGKISVPAEILSKPGMLSEMEFRLIKIHSQSAYDILKDAGLPYPLAETVLQHHERLDGSGYPRGLKNGHILLESRIITVADVVEAMASHRPYRPAPGIDAALAEIEMHKGILYDEEAVEACTKLFREKGYSFE